MTLRTDRLILRRWVEEDAEDLYRYASDPDIGPIAGWLPHRSIEDSISAIETYFAVRPEAYALCLNTDNRAIGAIELKLREHSDIADADDECEMGFWIGKPFWGRGLVQEAAQAMLRYAFEELGMHTVYCAHYDGNIKSQRVQEKLGFTYRWTTEGIELPALDEVRTGHVNAMTKDEWVERANSEPPMTR